MTDLYTDTKGIKLKGIKRLLNSYRFIKVDLKEERKYKLVDELNINDNVIVKEKPKRKFDTYTIEDQNVIILNLIIKSYMEIKKFNYDISIIDYCKKSNRFEITDDEFNRVLNINIKKLLK